MTALEDKLRDALTATADLVTPESLRTDAPLDVAAPPAPAPTADHGTQRPHTGTAGGSGRARPPSYPGLRAHRHRHRRRALVPALVVVVVLASIAGIVALTRLLAGDEERITPAVLPAVSPARYFVTTLAGGSHLDQPYQELTIRDAATGAVTAVVPPLDDSVWSTPSATADPRTFFVLSATKGLDISVTPPPVRAPNRMYRLVVSPDGQVESLTPIDSLGEPRFSGFAASPDGRRLAIDGSAAGTAGHIAGITLLDVASGETRTFLADRPGATATDLTWSADGRHLAYQLVEYQGYSTSPNGPVTEQEPSDQAGIWILDTTLNGGDLRASSRRVTRGNHPPVGSGSGMALDTTGTRLYTVVSRHSQNPYLTKQIIEYDTTTGRQLRVLLTLSHDYSLSRLWDVSSLVSDPSGRLLMFSDAGADYYRIDLGTGRTTRLPTTVNRGSPNGLAW